MDFVDAGRAGGRMRDCALRRSGLTTATAATAQDLGRVSFAGGSTNGVVRLTDSSLDNANCSYWLECQLNVAFGWASPTPTTGLYGADVIYTISSAKG